MIHAARSEDAGAMIETLGSAAIAASADRDEGVAAFREKREPDFPGT
jgi:enoyl-CoA hydratase/carnithine racemase